VGWIFDFRIYLLIHLAIRLYTDCEHGWAG